MQQPKINPERTLIKFKTLTKLPKNDNIEHVISTVLPNKRVNKYKINNKGQTIFPYQDFIIYRNGTQVAQIDLRPLSSYPQYQHHIHTKTYNENSPFSQSPQSQLIINFSQFPYNLSSGFPLKLFFIDAQITHDTETFTSMDPYIKVKINDTETWKSKTIKKGGKLPNFNLECCTLNLKNLETQITVQLWDDDMNNDDYIGGVSFFAYQLFGRYGDVVQYVLNYRKKQKSLSAGKVRFQIQGPKIK